MKETVLAAALALSLGSPSAFAAETADVVVVGAGAAGLSASIGAAARGAKVILLEKTTDAGGNTAFAKLGLNAAATPDLAAARITGDSPTLFAADTIRYGHQINDAALVRAMTVTSAPALLAPNSASGSPPWGAKSGRASWRPATEPRSVPASSRF